MRSASEAEEFEASLSNLLMRKHAPFLQQSAKKPFRRVFGFLPEVGLLVPGSAMVFENARRRSSGSGTLTPKA